LTASTKRVVAAGLDEDDLPSSLSWKRSREDLEGDYLFAPLLGPAAAGSGGAVGKPAYVAYASGAGDSYTSGAGSHTSFLLDQQKRSLTLADSLQAQSIQVEFARYVEKTKSRLPRFELRIRDGSYTVVNTVYEKHPKPTKEPSDVDDDDNGDIESPEPRRAKQKIETVITANPFYRLYVYVKYLSMAVVCGRPIPKRTEQRKSLLRNANLCLETGKMYLVLGAPGSGKSTLLKYISNTLFQDKAHVMDGSLDIAGIGPTQKSKKKKIRRDGVYWSNLVAYIDQIDRLHEYLTVKGILVHHGGLTRVRYCTLICAVLFSTLGYIVFSLDFKSQRRANLPGKWLLEREVPHVFD